MSASPSVRRGLVLLEQKRYADAEKYFREALAVDPTDSEAIFYLALCAIQLDRLTEALEMINQALALEPERADFHTMKSCVLTDLKRLPEAMIAANEGLRLDPGLEDGYTARAAVYLAQYEWAKAEAEARQALRLEPEDTVAASQLATALRMQNRLSESTEQINSMLSRDPESPATHASAGWVALQRGQNHQAETCFLEALRLDASNERAQEGLKEAFRARSLTYRTYLRYCFFMQQFLGRKWTVLPIGVLIGVVLIAVMGVEFSIALLVVLYLFLTLWTQVITGIGNFQLIIDPMARHALTRGEKWEAWFVGAGVSVGVVLLLVALVTSSTTVGSIGVTLISAAIPCSYTFTNHSPRGRMVFGLLAAFIYCIGVTNLQSFHPTLFPHSILLAVYLSYLCSRLSFLKSSAAED